MFVIFSFGGDVCSLAGVKGDRQTERENKIDIISGDLVDRFTFNLKMSLIFGVDFIHRNQISGALF